VKYSIQLSLGEKLLIYRRRSGISRNQLAEMVKISSASLKNYENDVTSPCTKTLTKISEALGISVDMLVFEPEDESKIKEPEEKLPTAQNPQQNKS
jgi:transcriptional regulator with XRE-family HTH domain